MSKITGGIVYVLLSVLVLFSFLSLFGCELLDLFSYQQNPLLDSECRPIPDKFNAGWKKYSDFDYRIPVNERSYEAKQFNTAEEKIAKLAGEVAILKRDYEIEKEAIQSLKEYRIALRAGHKANLIKTTVRMSYITYKAMDSAKGTGKLYSEFLSGSISTGVEAVGKAIKIGRAIVPPKSSIAIDTSTIEGKVKDVRTTGWVETLASIDDPKEVVTEVMKATQGHVVPSAELTPKELKILRQEHLELKRVDKVIQLSTKANTDRLWKYRGKEQEITYLKADLWEWEIKEKGRVRGMLVEECKRNQKDDE